MIEHVVPGGPAYHSKNLETGDKILEVDGMQVQSDDIDHFLSGRSDGNERQGQPYVKITLLVQKSSVSSFPTSEHLALLPAKWT